jgi:hypothetical protein
MAPVKPQVPANIIKGAQDLGWYTNPALKNISFGTGFNQPAAGASNPLGSVAAKTKALQEMGIDPKPYIQSFIENDTLTSMMPKPFNLAEQEQIIKMNEASQLRVANERQKLGDESTKKALLYSSINDIGNMLATGIAGTPEQRQRVNNAYTNALESTSYIRPSTLIVSPGSAIGQRDYFK